MTQDEFETMCIKTHKQVGCLYDMMITTFIISIAIVCLSCLVHLIAMK